MSKSSSFLNSNPANPLEQKIYSYLQKGLSSKQIFKKIKNYQDIHSVSHFLYIAGLEKTLFELSIARLKKRENISWPYLLKIFIKYKITPKKELSELLFHNWLKTDQSERLFACEKWGDVSPEFQNMQEVYLEKLEEVNLSEEKKLLEKLYFVQAQNLISEEEEIIEQLIKINPSSEEYQKLKLGLKEKKALLVIKEQKKHSFESEKLQKKPLNLVDRQEPCKKEWLSALFDYAKQNPKQTKNLALFLYFCDYPKQAVDLLDTYVEKFSDYWFYLDWLLESQQYTRGLALVNLIISQHKEAEAHVLPLTYLKALFLYHLGKKQSAIEYLRSITEINPDYKSSSYFLEMWSKNV